MLPNYSERLFIPEDRLVVLSDLHIPCLDGEYYREALENAARHHCEAVVLLGDVLDMQHFSPFKDGDFASLFADELRMAYAAVSMAIEHTGKCYWAIGNHEMRWLRKNDNLVCLEHLARMANLGQFIDAGMLVISELPSLHARGNWLLTHPGQYSAVRGKVAEMFAIQEQCNVMLAHSHTWNWGVDCTGRYVIVDTGCMLDADKVRYVHMLPKAPLRWVQGYWLLLNGEEVGFKRRRGHGTTDKAGAVEEAAPRPEGRASGARHRNHRT